MAPPQHMISLAKTFFIFLPFLNVTPMAFLPSNKIRNTMACVMTVKFSRCLTGWI